SSVPDRRCCPWKSVDVTRDLRRSTCCRMDIWWVANVRTVWPMSHRDIWWVGTIQNRPPPLAPIVPMGRRTQRIRIFLPTNGRYATGCLTFGNYLMLPETLDSGPCPIGTFGG